MTSPKIGIKNNKLQFALLVLMAISAGAMLGTLRTVIPSVSESEFGVAKDSFFMLTSFIVAFGFIKAIMNFVAGTLSESYGRKKMLMLGWFLSIPIPFILYWAPNWNWVILATILLGLSQGFSWSMAQMMKLDLAKVGERGFILGLNEFAGYSGVAISGYLTAIFAQSYGPREVILAFGVFYLILAFLALPFLHESMSSFKVNNPYDEHPNAHKWSTTKLFVKCSFVHKKLRSLNQAGLVEKFVDSLIWVIYPVWLLQVGFDLKSVGLLTAAYGLTWGGVQLFTGAISDWLGRKPMIIVGMLGCALSLALMPSLKDFQSQFILALSTGLSMAILYPTLLAGVADWSHSHWRGKTIGIYRFWRDLGYGIAALSMATLASLFGNLEVVFYGVAVALTLSTIEVAIRYKEYIPRPRYWKTVGESIRLLNKESRVLIIDVREEWEFAKGHIDEAINIPLENLCHSNLKEVLDPETTYLLACSKGRKRSKIASKHLNEMGLTSYWIHGGTYSWQKKMVGVKV